MKANNIQKLTISVYHHTHWDREWYVPMRVYQMRLAKVIDELQARLAPVGSIQNFTLDGQTALLEDALELRPHLAPWLREQIAAKRLAIGPWFVMPDTYLVSGESLLRNLLLGIETSQAWGQSGPLTGYLPDPFGQAANLPKILNHVGITSAVVWRGVHPKSPLSPVFWWEGEDESRLLTYHLAQGYFQNIAHDPTLSANEREQGFSDWIQTLSAQPFAEELGILIPVGGDHLGPLTSEGLEELTRILSQYSDHLETVTIDRFMDALENSLSQQKNICIPSHTGELRDSMPGSPYLLSGVWSSRLYLKKENRNLEHALTQRIEPLLSLAKRSDPEFTLPQAELDLAWRLLMLNHPHDSICGCSVDAVHAENEIRFAQVTQLTAELEKDALAHLASSLQPSQDDFLIWHTGQTSRSGVIPFVWRGNLPAALENHPAIQITTRSETLIDHWRCDTQDVPQADRTRPEVSGWLWLDPSLSIPPMSVVTHSAMALTGPSKGQSVHSVEPNGLDNGLIRLTIQPDGSLQVLDHQTGNISSRLHTITISPERGDSYNPGLTQPAQFAQLVSVTVADSRPLVGSLVLRYQLPTQSEPISTTITLKAGAKMLEFETAWVNQSDDCRISVGFETDAAITDVLEESHFGVFRRAFTPAPEAIADSAAGVLKGQEWQAPTGPIQRFITTQGHALITEGLTEYWVEGHELRLTLHRGFGVLSDDQTGTRGGQAGPPLPTPGGQCLGRKLSFRYAWQAVDTQQIAHDLTSLYHAADAFYGVSQAIGKPLTLPSSSHMKIDWSTVGFEDLFAGLPSGVIVSAFHPHGHGWRIRLFNLTAQTFSPQDLWPDALNAWTIRAVNAVDNLELAEQSLNPFGLQSFFLTICH